MVYGSKEYREKRDKEIRTWMEERTQIIDNIPDNYFKGICYFSLIEKFAQEYSDYPANNSKNTFCDFVLKFKTSYAFLNEHDPVTLYYDYKTQLKKKFNLSFLDHGINHNPDQAIQHGKAKEMLECLEMLGVRDYRIKNHKYVNLLYSLRSKLSHELSSHNDGMLTDLHLLSEYPYYVSCLRSYPINGSVVCDQVWQLVVPVGFIRKLALECINNYLDYSLENKDDPFENDKINRHSHIAWYDEDQKQKR